MGRGRLKGRLKPGWTRVAFGDVVRQVKEHVDPTSAGLERYVAGEHMDTDELRLRRWGTVGVGYLGPAFHARFRPGQVLYGSRRTYLRKVAVADFEGVTANTTFVIEAKDPNLLLPALLPFIMQTEAFHEHSIEKSKGSVNPYVNFSDIAAYQFVLPPLDEQRRMANLLRVTSALVARISDIFEVADTIRKIIYDRYFWKTDNTALKTTIGEVAVVCNGTTPKRSNSHYWNGDLPWLPSAKVNEVYITRADEHITRRALDECSLTIVPSESTLIAMIGQGATRGRAALLQMEATINQNLAAVTPGADVHPRFLFYQLDAQYRALRYWSQGSNQHALNCQLIADFPIWVPAMPTQVGVARQLDRCVDASRASSARAVEVRTLQKNTIESLLG